MVFAFSMNRIPIFYYLRTEGCQSPNWENRRFILNLPREIDTEIIFFSELLYEALA